MATIFLLDTTVYGVDLSDKSHLRVPMMGGFGKRESRLRKAAEGISKERELDKTRTPHARAMIPDDRRQYLTSALLKPGGTIEDAVLEGWTWFTLIKSQVEKDEVVIGVVPAEEPFVSEVKDYFEVSDRPELAQRLKDLHQTRHIYYRIPPCEL